MPLLTIFVESGQLPPVLERTFIVFFLTLSSLKAEPYSLERLIDRSLSRHHQTCSESFRLALSRLAQDQILPDPHSQRAGAFPWDYRGRVIVKANLLLDYGNQNRATLYMNWVQLQGLDIGHISKDANAALFETVASLGVFLSAAENSLGAQRPQEILLIARDVRNEAVRKMLLKLNFQPIGSSNDLERLLKRPAIGSRREE